MLVVDFLAAADRAGWYAPEQTAHPERQRRAAEGLRAFHAARAPEREARLRERTARIAELRARGLTDRAMAVELGISRGALDATLRTLRARGQEPPRPAQPTAKTPAPKYRYERLAPGGPGTPWTAAEDRHLMRWWGRVPDDRLERALRRSRHAIRHRAYLVLKIAKRENLDLSAQQAGRLLGVACPDVLRWIAAGHLRAERGGFARGGGQRRVWSISEESLAAFIDAHGYLLSPARVADPAWRELVEEAHAAHEWLTIPELTARLGYGAQTLYQWIERGLLPAGRRGRPVHFVARWRDAVAARDAHEAGVFRNRSEARKGVHARFGLIGGWQTKAPPKDAPFAPGDRVRCVGFTTEYDAALGREGVVVEVKHGYRKRGKGCRGVPTIRVAVEFPNVGTHRARRPRIVYRIAAEHLERVGEV